MAVVPKLMIDHAIGSQLHKSSTITGLGPFSLQLVAHDHHGLVDRVWLDAILKVLRIRIGRFEFSLKKENKIHKKHSAD